jgi:riboflavin synthase
MFTGIIQAVGEITAREPRGGDARVRIRTGKLDLDGIGLGDSIATGGVCLTVVDLPGNGFEADVSLETLQRTTLGAAAAGQAVNLERSLMPASQLGGHIVSGHVDGVGSLHRRHAEARSVRMQFQAPEALAKYIAEKGSICVDGVSLTVNSVDGARFSVNIVPHTLEETTLGGLVAGSAVNLEVDIIARYLERLMLGERAARAGSVTEQLLAEHGFMRD